MIQIACVVGIVIFIGLLIELYHTGPTNVVTYGRISRQAPYTVVRRSDDTVYVKSHREGNWLYVLGTGTLAIGGLAILNVRMGEPAALGMLVWLFVVADAVFVLGVAIRLLINRGPKSDGDEKEKRKHKPKRKR